MLRRRSGGSPLSRPGRGRARPERQPSGLGGEHVEGRQAVRELLRARTRRVHQLFVADVIGSGESHREIADLAVRAGVPVRWVSRQEIDAMAGTDSPQGVVARAAPLREWHLDDLVGMEPGSDPPFIVVLDGVTDPHNLGAVMRTALCAGATGLVIGRHRAAHLTPAAVKAAAGAVEHLPVATVAGIPAAIGQLRDAGVWTVGLDALAGSSVWDLAVATEPVALVLGAEGRGLAPLVRRRCDLLVGIPMRGPLGALNVSAAAALACFEVARRRFGE